MKARRNRSAQRGIEWAPGVPKEERLFSDAYTGTADALVAAGLVHREHLPGSPGMRNTRVNIYADRAIPLPPHTASWYRSNEPGAKLIVRESQHRFSVTVVIDEDLSEARCLADRLSRGIRSETRQQPPGESRLRLVTGSDGSMLAALPLVSRSRPTLTLIAGGAGRGLG